MNNNPHIKEIQALKKQPDSSKANLLLIKLSNHVQRIMTKRCFKVLHLKEFYPKNKNLLGLNMNRGYMIKIRLRHPEDNTRFLEFNDLIGTMLHELVHIKVGPHDSKFYKLLDELWNEYEKSIADGFMPDGTKLQGRKLDSGERLKQLEKRIWLSSLMGNSQKLGGTIMELSPAEMVRMATLKRIEDNQRCQHIQVDLTQQNDSEDEYEIDTTIPLSFTPILGSADLGTRIESKVLSSTEIIDLTDDSKSSNPENSNVIIID